MPQNACHVFQVEPYVSPAVQERRLFPPRHSNEGVALRLKSVSVIATPEMCQCCGTLDDSACKKKKKNINAEVTTPDSSD